MAKIIKKSQVTVFLATKSESNVIKSHLNRYWLVWPIYIIQEKYFESLEAIVGYYYTYEKTMFLYI